jgi:hypothetical protein
VCPRAAAEDNQPVRVDKKLIGMPANPPDGLAQVFDCPGPTRFAGAGQLVIRREDDVPMPRQACELWPVLRFRSADPASAVDRQHAREQTRTASLNRTIRRQVDVKLRCAGCSHAVNAVPEDGLILAARGRRRQQGIAEPEPGKQPDDAHPTQGMNDEPDPTHRPGGYSLEDVCAFSLS